jgi:hypothetical protein
MQNRENSDKTPWVLTRPGVLVMLFFVTGIFGLPLLAKSPAFTKPQKILLTILVTIYTIALLIAFAVFLFYMYKLAISVLQQ